MRGTETAAVSMHSILNLSTAMHIQCSSSTYELLCKLGGFQLESRGTIEVKVWLMYILLSCIDIFLMTAFLLCDREKVQWRHGG